MQVTDPAKPIAQFVEFLENEEEGAGRAEQNRGRIL